MLRVKDRLTSGGLAGLFICTALILTACGSDNPGIDQPTTGATAPPAASGVSAPVTPVTPVTTSAFTISGTVSGLTTGQSVSVELNGGGAQALTGLASGAAVPFTFPSVSSGSTYAVTVSSAPAGLFCPVSGGQGTLSANVSGIAVSCHVPDETVLHSFTGTPDGGQSSAPLLMDSQGNLFGTTVLGGANGLGAVFEIKSTGPDTWSNTVTTLYSFTGGVDGEVPKASLIMDSQGDLFGTTVGSGPVAGTAFELKSTGPASWATALNTLATFPILEQPEASLIMDSQGNLFGTTFVSNFTNNEYGTVFEIPSTGPGTWATTPTTLYSFTGNADGANPVAALIMDNQGDLLGTTAEGGGSGSGGSGLGVIFELKSTGPGTWATAPITLYAFTGGADGALPEASLLMDSQGNLFGTTVEGGAGANDGVVFELMSTGPGTWASTTTTLYSFQGGGADGLGPEASLVMDSQGDLLGTTFQGGISNEGTVFELNSTGPGSWSATSTLLHSFTGGTDGEAPLAPLIMDSQGHLFGTTFNGGGITDSGTVFELH
jgi:hypothetical protein